MSDVMEIKTKADTLKVMELGLDITKVLDRKGVQKDLGIATLLAIVGSRMDTTPKMWTPEMLNAFLQTTADFIKTFFETYGAAKS